MSAASEGDTVRVHYTGTLDDGTVFDSSSGRDPIEFTIGQQKLIPGFENGVIGLDIGDRKRVVVGPEEAYGPHHADRVINVERSKLPPDPEPEVGAVLVGNTPEGEIHFRIVELAEETVTLDANHPLAGEQLTFDVELVEIVAS